MFTTKRLAVFIPVIAMLLCLVSLSVQGATFNLNAAADAHVRGGANASTNYGTTSTLEVRDGPDDGYTRETYLKFDLSSVTGTS